MVFKKAVRSSGKLRMALIGPSGSGKTWTALSVAKHLGKRIAVIDSERGSASKYAGYAASFDVCELDTFAPKTYVEAIEAADRDGYDVIVIDSLSHAWMGKAGAIEMVDNAAARSRSANKFAAWREVTPEHNRLVDAILHARAHVIVTLRVKTEWVLEEDEKGKKVPKKVGMQPVQRDGIEYEFDVICDIDTEHTLMVGKTRCPALDKAVFRNPTGAELATTITSWLSDGTPREERTVALPVPEVGEPKSWLEEDPPRPARSLTECSSVDELRAWVRDQVPTLANEGKTAKRAWFLGTVEVAQRLGVSAETVKMWCGEFSKREEAA